MPHQHMKYHPVLSQLQRVVTTNKKGRNLRNSNTNVLKNGSLVKSTKIYHWMLRTPLKQACAAKSTLTSTTSLMNWQKGFISSLRIKIKESLFTNKHSDTKNSLTIRKISWISIAKGGDKYKMQEFYHEMLHTTSINNDQLYRHHATFQIAYHHLHRAGP